MPAVMFVLMPQWQGSPSSRAMQIAEGAALLREDLPAAARREVTVPLEAGDAMGTPVARLSSLMRARDAARELLIGVGADSHVPIIVGGDCATSLVGIEAAVERHGAESLAVLWCDAHPDIQHPSTSPSGSASGMTLRHVLGDGAPDLVSSSPALATHITLVGARASDPEEEAELTRLGIPNIHPSLDGTAFDQSVPEDAGKLDAAPAATTSPRDAPSPFATTLANRLAELGATHVYVHIDLDVLDPAAFSAVHASVPFGLSVAELLDVVRTAVGTLELAGATISEFAPANEAMAADDLPTILRLLGALTSGARA